MNIKVEITPVERYQVKINDEQHEEFERESSWEGLVKLTNKRGSIIIIDDSNFVDKMFDGLFDKKKSTNHLVVTISPNLIPTSSLKTDKESK